MGSFQIKATLSFFVVLAAAVASGSVHHRLGKPPAFFLAGDSTTAVDGGWGNGLLAPLIQPAWGINFGLSGATTASFVAQGRWANLTAYVKEYAATYDCYVTISFGHNDQKPENNVPFDVYQQNLINFANQVKSLGGAALLVSSLTRRVFPDNPHNATDSLHNERRDAAWTYNWGDDRADMTHLNPYGEVVFGRMVADLIIRAKPDLRRWIMPNETLSYDIWNNLPAR
ncbi:SGNH hydrolase-type esterase domain-containing protein [Xylaria sp. FL1777]|nr:SGNH hydrolase-type esterase domain-containing protein [Xylaria sp. FL1777]